MMSLMNFNKMYGAKLVQWAKCDVRDFHAVMSRSNTNIWESTKNCLCSCLKIIHDVQVFGLISSDKKKVLLSCSAALYMHQPF